MEFEKRKSEAIASLDSATIDKSPKGTVDQPILPLLQSINSHSSFYSTSSCSGRVSILSTPSTSSTKKKAGGGTWIFISHSPADSDHVISVLFNDSATSGNDLVFRFEPFILAVECRNVALAGDLVSLAIRCGFRESGITSIGKKRDRIIVGIRSSIRMEVPLGAEGNLLVSKDYVKFLVKLANEKMQSNRLRYEHFHRLFKEEMLQVQEPKCISTSTLSTLGLPREKLHLFGHSSSSFDVQNETHLFIFGGFGGVGRHSRRNESLILNLQTGFLTTVNAQINPPSRLGHSSSFVDNSVYIIGGRANPSTILNDVWDFDLLSQQWTTIEQTSGTHFTPRHRHASSVINTKIFIHGGLNNDSVLSSLFIFDTKTHLWEEIKATGELPSGRHSHAMIPYDDKLFLFGGYNSQSTPDLGELYSFDISTFSWKKVETSGNAPRPRFSHSMFLYGDKLGVIGGCPLNEELAIFDICSATWQSIRLTFFNHELLVRCTSTVVGDDLVVVGGGASCYAFGTKFSDPLKINLRFLKNKLWVLRISRNYAKFVKDVLRKCEWLDDGRKVYANCDGDVCFPVVESLALLFDGEGNCEDVDLLKEKGAEIAEDDVVEIKKCSKSHSQKLREDFAALIEKKGLPKDLCLDLPSRWERLGDMVIFPTSSFRNPIVDSIADELWPTIARSINCTRVARQGRVASTKTRDSTLELLLGSNGWVDHIENGVVYTFDATKCMFSWGNLSEKIRMANLDCQNEVVLDLFAGIGAKAKMVYACEWNPHAIDALTRNLAKNNVSDRCVVLPGDNRLVAPQEVADRVCLGLLPTSEGSWATAVRALKKEGGVLHIHSNVTDKDEPIWIQHVLKAITELAIQDGRLWEISVLHVERVKWYAPHVRHLVVDVMCKNRHTSYFS